MKKLNRLVIGYFLGTLPLLGLMLLTDLSHVLYEKAKVETWADWVNGALGFSMSLWMLAALYLGISLVLSQTFREELLAKIIRIKERDERESLIAGVAAKKVFFSSIAVVSLLLALSMFQVSVKPIPENQQINGHKHTLSLGLKFSPWNTNAEMTESAAQPFAYQFPVTTSGVLLILLVWHLASFHWYSRFRD